MNMKIVKMLHNSMTKKAFIFVSAFVIIYCIMLTSIVPETYNLKEGEIAKSDITAQRDVEDKIATVQREKEAADSVGQQYDKKVEGESQAEQDLNSNFDKANGIRGQNIQAAQKIDALRTSVTYNLTNSEFSTWINLSAADNSDLQNFIIKVIKGTYNLDIREDSSSDIKSAQNYISNEFDKSRFNKDIVDLGTAISENYIKTNLFVDEEKTQEMKEEAKKKVSPVMIKKDQIVVTQGEPITKEELQILSDLGVLNNNKASNWYVYLSLGALDFAIMLIQVYYLYKHQREIFNNDGNLVLIFLLGIIYLILARSIYIISPFLIPLAFLPMLYIILLNDRIALFISLTDIILMSIVVQFDAQLILIAIISVLVAVMVLKKMQMRNDILYASIYIALVNVSLTFFTGFLVSNNIVNVFTISIYSFLGAFFSSILTIGFLPVMENIFGIITQMKLLELSNPNQPLLKRLLMEAPGTYHHSIMVANLAEIAAEEVGANQVLVRAASYYHDIGKVKRPYFFKENQITSDNPHDKMTPNLSALVIISHIKDGIELAKEYKLPKVIQDAIAQHHGTTLAKYFYITMKNSSDNPEEIKEENFRYPGPIPNSKECAIIMLADSVEAAVRSIKDPSKWKIEEMVNNIINSKLSEGQLDNCDITFRDLNKIKGAFLSSLTGIYHKRIEYPKDKSEITNKEEKKV